MRNVFVTGGSGFIGSAFVRAAVAAGWEVRALARSAASADRLRALGASPVHGDVLDALLGRVVTESLQYENRLSNARLRATGFAPEFPTYAEGVPDAVATWLRENAAAGAQRTATAASSA